LLQELGAALSFRGGAEARRRHRAAAARAGRGGRKDWHRVFTQLPASGAFTASDLRAPVPDIEPRTLSQYLARWGRKRSYARRERSAGRVTGRCSADVPQPRWRRRMRCRARLRALAGAAVPSERSATSRRNACAPGCAARTGREPELRTRKARTLDLRAGAGCDQAGPATAADDGSRTASSAHERLTDVGK
jgi:hypothetical protein